MGHRVSSISGEDGCPNQQSRLDPLNKDQAAIGYGWREIVIQQSAWYQIPLYIYIRVNPRPAQQKSPGGWGCVMRMVRQDTESGYHFLPTDPTKIGKCLAHYQLTPPTPHYWGVPTGTNELLLGKESSTKEQSIHLRRASPCYVGNGCLCSHGRADEDM